MASATHTSGTKSRTPKPKKRPLTLTPDLIGFKTFAGKIVICDLDAPMEFGCPLVLTMSGEGFVCVGTCLTKHPSKAKCGVTIKFKNSSGDEGVLHECGGPGGESKVYRIVGELQTIPFKPRGLWS